MSIVVNRTEALLRIPVNWWFHDITEYKLLSLYTYLVQCI